MLRSVDKANAMARVGEKGGTCAHAGEMTTLAFDAQVLVNATLCSYQAYQRFREQQDGSLRRARRAPRSRSLRPRALNPDRAASSSCVRPAVSRYRRRRSPKFCDEPVVISKLSPLRESLVVSAPPG